MGWVRRKSRETAALLYDRGTRYGSGCGFSLSYHVVIRGLLGVGRTAVATRLAREIGAGYISIERILDNLGLWEAGRLSEFLRARRLRGLASLDRPLAR